MLKILKSISLSRLIILAIVFFSFVNTSCYPQENSNHIPQEIVNKCYQFLYHFQFKKADSLISKIIKSYPHDPLSKVLEANKYWWLLVSEDYNKKLSTRFLTSLVEAENLVLTNKKIYSERESFLLINIYAYKSRLDLLNQNYLQALKHLDKSIDIIKTSLGKSSTYEPLFFTEGLYNYFMGKAKSDYWMAFPLLRNYPKAETAKGIEMLSKCSLSKDKLIQTEATYFLMKIFLESEKNATLATPFVKTLVTNYPDNLIFQYYYYKILLDNGDTKLISEQLVRFNKCFENTELTGNQITHFQSLIHKDLVAFYSKK